MGGESLAGAAVTRCGDAGRAGPAAVAQLLAKWPGLKIVRRTGRDADEPLPESIRAGAVGYLLKGAGSDAIIEGLDDAVAGGAPMSATIAKRVLALLREPAGKVAENPRVGDGARDLAQLMGRELELLALVANGDANKEICAQLKCRVPQ